MKIYKPLIPSFEPIGHQYHDSAGMALDSITTILKEELGLYQFSSQAAPVRGTDVHAACQYHDEGGVKEDNLTYEVVQYFEQYKLALAAHSIKVRTNELMRYSKKYAYAGRLDKIATIENENGVLDLKTCKNMHEEKWHKWQTAAYFEMVKKEFAANDFPLTKRWVLYLSPDSFRLVEHTGKRDFVEFLALMAARTIKINNGFLKTKREKHYGE